MTLDTMNPVTYHGFMTELLTLRDIAHARACLAYLMKQALAGVHVTGDGDEEDVRANVEDIERTLHRVAALQEVR